MSDFKAKMHQNRFRLGLCPRPRWGSSRRCPRPASRLGGDRRLGRLHSRALGTRLGFAVPSLCPWRRLCLRLLCKLHKIWSVDSQDNHQNWCHQMSDF